MTKLKILVAPDPILNQKAKSIKSVNNDIRKLMDDMLETMHSDHGIGLAANQVGVLQRVIVIHLDEDHIKTTRDLYPLRLANPEIIDRSQELVEADEGCLSVPGQRIPVLRPEWIKIRFLNYNNTMQEIVTGDWLARVLQHEIDHLDGKLIVHYLSKLKQDVCFRKLVKIKKISQFLG